VPFLALGIVLLHVVLSLVYNPLCSSSTLGWMALWTL